ncbi:unnamed protein product, partial [Ilex paraguariensis]
IGELKDLETLSFIGSEVAELPREIGQLIRLRLLDLTDCSYLKLIPAGVIASLTRLECLYLRNGFKDWSVDGQDMGRNNASLTELKHLSYLRTLEIEVLDVEIYPKDLLSGNQLIEYKIAIGSSFLRSDVKNNSRALKLSRCQSIIQEGGGVSMMLKRAEALILTGLEDVETVLNYFRIDAFSNLKRLKVDGCGGKIEYLVDTTERMSPSIFPVVEILDLRSMQDFRQICHGHLPSTSFSELRELLLDNLPKLINLWEDPTGQAQLSSLRQLQHLHLDSCDNMEAMLAINAEGAVAEADEIVLHKLEELNLWNLPDLNLEYLSISKCYLLEDLYEGHDATSVTLPKIRTVLLLGLPKLKDTWWNKACHESRSFENLKELTIGGCNCKRYVFSFTTSKLLIQLQELVIEECDMMKEIIATEREEDGEVVDAIVFPKLFYLSLGRMPELTSFYQGNCTLEFQSLEALKIEKCPKMQTFVGSSTNRSKEASEEGLEGQTDQEGNYSVAVKPFFNKKRTINFQDTKCDTSLILVVVHNSSLLRSPPGKLGEGEEKEEEETLTTQQFPREVCKEAEDKA